MKENWWEKPKEAERQLRDLFERFMLTGEKTEDERGENGKGKGD